MWPFLNEDVLNLLKRLITNVTDVRENTDRFRCLEHHVISELKAADSMVFVTKKDLDATMSSFSDKFIFHGFCSQAEELRNLYERFMKANLSYEETERKINAMRLLVCLSESPTKSFAIFPRSFVPIADEDIIDWPTYLREGIQRWSPPLDESSESWTDDSRSIDSSMDECDNEESVGKTAVANEEKSLAEDVLQQYVNGRETLSSCIQNTWFTLDHVYMAPSSQNVDANIAVHWDDFLQYSTKGLVKLDRSAIITEYKIMREILWQLWEPHTSFVFHFVKNSLLPRPNITVSSVRSEPLERFLYEFLPYMELLQNLRDFHSSLTLSENAAVIPETYKSYDCAVNNIIKPLYIELLQLETEIMSQESLMSLLQLADRLRKLFRNARIIKAIHERAMLDFKANSPLRCATTLLSRLHTGLLHCIDKNEQDIYLSIYLESLYKYFTVIDLWLSQDALIDLTEEFVIADENPKDPHMTSMCNSYFSKSDCLQIIGSKNVRGHPDWQMEFVIRDLDETLKTDSMLRAIYTEVLQIGKNIHLLHLLDKLHLLKNNANSMTLHEELTNRVLQKMASYFSCEEMHESNYELEPELKDSGISLKFPAICSDDCKYPTEMDRLENLMDTSDGFLMNAFASYFTEKEERASSKEASLYEKVSAITENMFPAKQIIDGVFAQILYERYSESGYMVKSVLTDEYHIEKHLRLLQHVYLFKDDLIYLLYRRVFQQLELNSWDNEAWLTNQLQDTLVNVYPEFHENCLVKIRGLLPGDPLQVCSRLIIEYKVEWPMNIIIRHRHMKMYAGLFHVILQIKWGLYTLNHLYFSEIESKRRLQNQQRASRDVITKLKVLRFYLLNEFSSIQHYVLGYVYNKCVRKFQGDFQRAYNLDTLIAAHDDFISGMYSMITTFRKFNESTYGFDLLLHLVRKLSSMWSDLKGIDFEELTKCELMYRRCHENLNPIMYPKDIFFNYS